MQSNQKLKLSDTPLSGISYLPTIGRVYGVIFRNDAPPISIDTANLTVADFLIDQLNTSLRGRYPGDGYYAHNFAVSDFAEDYVLFADNEFYKHFMEDAT